MTCKSAKKWYLMHMCFSWRCPFNRLLISLSNLQAPSKRDWMPLWARSYYNKSARDLNELKPGDTVRVKPETLVKGQEWKNGTVTQSHGYRSYDVNVEGKVIRRNRVHRKPDKQVKITEPSLKSEEQTRACTWNHKTDRKDFGNLMQQYGTDYCKTNTFRTPS